MATTYRFLTICFSLAECERVRDWHRAQGVQCICVYVPGFNVWTLLEIVTTNGETLPDEGEV